MEVWEGFRRGFADGLNQSFVPSVTQASRFRFCLMSAPHLSHRVKNASSSIKQHRKLITRDDVVSQRHKFGSAFLSYFSWVSKNCLLFLTFPYPVPVTKNCVIFIGCNFESRSSQVGLHRQKKDTASAKEGKVSLLR